MKKIGIYFGSTTGATENIAEQLAEKMAVNSNDIKDVSRFKAEEFLSYDVLLLGTSTWGDGDLQDDWYDALDELKLMDISAKQIGLFGCGDSDSYSDSFCNGVGELYSALSSCGAQFIGFVSTDNYQFHRSTAQKEDHFVGLLLDEDNESSKSGQRVSSWVEQLKQEAELS